MWWARTSIWSHIGDFVLSVLRGSFGFFIPATTANDLRLRRISIQDLIHYICFPILNFIYITTITKQVIQLILIMLVDQHRCLRSDGLRVGGNRSARSKPTDLLTTWPSHMPTPGIEPRSQRWEASQPYWWSWHLLYSNELLRRVRRLIHK